MPISNMTQCREPKGIIRHLRLACWRIRHALASTLFAALLCLGCTVPIGGFSAIPLEGTVVDEETGQPLAVGTVLVRALCCGADELGRQQGRVFQGAFSVPIPILAESPAPDEYEVTVSRGSCESVFLFDVSEDVTFVDLPFPRGFLFRVSDPIGVPQCAEDGDGPP